MPLEIKVEEPHMRLLVAMDKNAIVGVWLKRTRERKMEKTLLSFIIFKFLLLHVRS